MDNLISWKAACAHCQPAPTISRILFCIQKGTVLKSKMPVPLDNRLRAPQYNTLQISLQDTALLPKQIHPCGKGSLMVDSLKTAAVKVQTAQSFIYIY